jgi:hypothetical protein
MAITSAICNSFKVEILTGVHNFTASTGDTFNLALYTSSATLDKDTTAYSVQQMKLLIHQVQLILQKETHLQV